MPAKRVEVVVKQTRVGKLPTVRDTEADTGVRSATDTESDLLVDHKQAVEDVLDSLSIEDAESGDVIGHFELVDGEVNFIPQSGDTDDREPTTDSLKGED